MRRKSERSIADIAAALGISTSTVSRALRQLPSISDKTTKLVLAEAQRQGYLQQSRKNVIILLPDTEIANYDITMLNMLNERMKKSDVTCEIVSARYFAIIPERLVHGIISMDYADCRSSNLVSKFNLPLVAINEMPYISGKVYAVYSDAFNGMKQAMDHLKDLGHTKVLYLFQNSTNFSSRTRLNAFHEIASTMSSVLWHAEPLRINRTYSENLLNIIGKARKSGFTAAIIEGESAGVYASSHLARAGYKIPEDLSLITYETPGISDVLPPSLTTLGQDFKALADKAMDIMEELWRGGSPPFSTTVNYIFNRRNSTAPPSV